MTFPTKILLATDGSKDAELATNAAIELANTTGSELHVVNVKGVNVYIDPSTETTRVVHGAAEETARREAQETLDAQVEKIEAAGGKVAQTYVRLGRPVEEIVILADEIDAGLVVVGSRGLGGIRRLLLGSVSDGVVRHAHCPVLIVRNEDKIASEGGERERSLRK